jgi:hypothetical protein
MPIDILHEILKERIDMLDINSDYFEIYPYCIFKDIRINDGEYSGMTLDEVLEYLISLIIPPGSRVFPVTSVNGKTGDVVLTKSDFSDLSNVDNTPDIDKELSHAFQTSLNSIKTDIRDILTNIVVADNEEMRKHLLRFDNPHKDTLTNIGGINSIVNVNQTQYTAQRVLQHNTDSTSHSDIRDDSVNVNSAFQDALSTFNNTIGDISLLVYTSMVPFLLDHNTNPASHSTIIAAESTLENEIDDFIDGSEAPDWVELFVNKVKEVTPDNKFSDVLYPTVKAARNYIDEYYIADPSYLLNSINYEPSVDMIINTYGNFNNVLLRATDDDLIAYIYDSTTRSIDTVALHSGDRKKAITIVSDTQIDDATLASTYPNRNVLVLVNKMNSDNRKGFQLLNKDGTIIDLSLNIIEGEFHLIYNCLCNMAPLQSMYDLIDMANAQLLKNGIMFGTMFNSHALRTTGMVVKMTDTDPESLEPIEFYGDTDSGLDFRTIRTGEPVPETSDKLGSLIFERNDNGMSSINVLVKRRGTLQNEYQKFDIPMLFAYQENVFVNASPTGPIRVAANMENFEYNGYNVTYDAGHLGVQIPQTMVVITNGHTFFNTETRDDPPVNNRIVTSGQSGGFGMWIRETLQHLTLGKYISKI